MAQCQIKKDELDEALHIIRWNQQKVKHAVRNSADESEEDSYYSTSSSVSESASEDISKWKDYPILNTCIKMILSGMEDIIAAL